MSDIDSHLVQLKKAIRDEMNTLADVLANGAVENIEQYRLVVGTIKGLAWAEERIDNILSAQEE